MAEHLGFSVWMIWSVVATRLPEAGFRFTPDELFTLVATAGLTGAILRFPYTFAVPRFGGRNWTFISALLLLIPTMSASSAWCWLRPGRNPYENPRKLSS